MSACVCMCMCVCACVCVRVSVCLSVCGNTMVNTNTPISSHENCYCPNKTTILANHSNFAKFGIPLRDRLISGCNIVSYCLKDSYVLAAKVSLHARMVELTHGHFRGHA